MYKVSIFYSDQNNMLVEDKPYYIDDISDIKSFEFQLTNYLQEKGKDFGYKEALIYVDLVKNQDPVYTGDMEQIYIYEANNINNNLNLTKAFHLLKPNEEDEIIFEQIDASKDNIKYTKKIMKIGGIITGISLTGFTIAFLKVIEALRTIRSIKSFDYLFNGAIAAIFALGTSVGIGTILGGAIEYYAEKKNLKNEELKLIKH